MKQYSKECPPSKYVCTAIESMYIPNIKKNKCSLYRAQGKPDVDESYS